MKCPTLQLPTKAEKLGYISSAFKPLRLSLDLKRIFGRLRLVQGVVVENPDV